MTFMGALLCMACAVAAMVEPPVTASVDPECSNCRTPCAASRPTSDSTRTSASASPGATKTVFTGRTCISAVSSAVRPCVCRAKLRALSSQRDAFGVGFIPALSSVIRPASRSFSTSARTSRSARFSRSANCRRPTGADSAIAVSTMARRAIASAISGAIACISATKSSAMPFRPFRLVRKSPMSIIPRSARNGKIVFPLPHTLFLQRRRFVCGFCFPLSF